MFKKILPLSHIDDCVDGRKNTILKLDNKFFSIFKIQIENIINEEDRLEKIEDKLEIIFPRYNSDDFVLRYEIIKKEKKKEIVVVYILNLLLLNDYIIDDMKDYKFISIIPSFFVCREKGNAGHYFNFDISEITLVVVEYMDNNIVDILNFKLSKTILNEDEKIDIEDKYSIINTCLANIENNVDIIFTGNKINFDDLDLANKNYLYFDVESLDFTKYPNFLPKHISSKYSLYYVNTKYLYFLLIISILTVLSTIILYYNIHKSEEKLEKLEIESSNFEDEINEARNEMKEIEKQHKELIEFMEKEKYQDFKINSFLEELSFLCPDGVKIFSIEYDENKVFNIEGNAEKVNEIVEFLENITNSKNFKLFNYDYILKQENKIDFKIEVKY